MQVASLELSKTLFELSGWDDTEFVWHWAEDYDCIDDSEWQVADRQMIARSMRLKNALPAYDLGYLLRKLPRKLNGINSKQRDGNFNLYASRGKSAWVASYADADGSIIRRLKKDAETQNNRNFWFMAFNADTPEDAACKLAIELFKQGVLNREEP